MKVIKKGWWVGSRFKCKGCGCIFELEEADYDGVSFTVTCPTCKKSLSITKPEEPKHKAFFEEIFGEGGFFEKIFGK